MSRVQFPCPACKKTVIVDGKYVGLNHDCPHCLSKLTVPLKATPYTPPEAAGPPKDPEGRPYKPCPFCTAYVPPYATKCKHCGSRLDKEAPKSSWGNGATHAPRTSGHAIASLILGLLPLTCLASVLAIIFGHIALSRIRTSPVLYKGKGLAKWGAGLGYFFTLCYMIYALLYVLGVV